MYHNTRADLVVRRRWRAAAVELASADFVVAVEGAFEFDPARLNRRGRIRLGGVLSRHANGGI
jgi:hypothetical protein